MSDALREHDLEALRLAAFTEQSTRRWSQYHNALQALYERGALVRVDLTPDAEALVAVARQMAAQTGR